MGLFGSSSPASPPPKLSTDGAPIAPDRTQRQKCWDARDAFFQCLDSHDIVDSITENHKATKACGTQSKGFDTNCASSWVVYFKKRRVMEHQRSKTLQKLEAENAQRIPGMLGTPPGKS